MNFQRKLWWAQHKNEVYKYGTILSFVLIVTISIIYFTYSKFTSTDEVTAYETTVEPFIKNDYFIASYVDGVWSDTIPGKDDGYIVDKIVCDNGATATWDDEEWGINIRNATKKIKCGVYFKKLVKLTEQITTLASTDTTNFASDDPDSNIRYIGADPSNYVYFNCSDYNNQNDSTCEKWRIIGLFNNVVKGDNSKENLVKIIRNEVIGNYMVDTASWPSSQVMMMLNPSDYIKSEYSISNDVVYDSAGNQIFKSMGSYYNGTLGCKPNDSSSCSSVDFTKIGLKNDNTRNAIEEANWYYKNVSDTTAEAVYNAEKSSGSTWIGKISLPYISDFSYISAGGDEELAPDRKGCLDSSIFNRRNAYCGGYLYQNTDYVLLAGLSSIVRNDDFIYKGFTAGHIEKNQLVYNDSDYSYFRIKPTLYLKSSIFILNGDGSETNPYQLKLQ